MRAGATARSASPSVSDSDSVPGDSEEEAASCSIAGAPRAVDGPWEVRSHTPTEATTKTETATTRSRRMEIPFRSERGSSDACLADSRSVCGGGSRSRPGRASGGTRRGPGRCPGPLRKLAELPGVNLLEGLLLGHAGGGGLGVALRGLGRRRLCRSDLLLCHSLPPVRTLAPFHHAHCRLSVSPVTRSMCSSSPAECDARHLRVVPRGRSLPPG